MLSFNSRPYYDGHYTPIKTTPQKKYYDSIFEKRAVKAAIIVGLAVGIIAGLVLCQQLGLHTAALDQLAHTVSVVGIHEGMIGAVVAAAFVVGLGVWKCRQLSCTTRSLEDEMSRTVQEERERLAKQLEQVQFDKKNIYAQIKELESAPNSEENILALAECHEQFSALNDEGEKLLQSFVECEPKHKLQSGGEKDNEPTVYRSFNYSIASAGTQELPEGRKIWFVNGIQNTLPQARDNALHLSRMSGGYKIQATYNGTFGMVDDLLEVYGNLHDELSPPVEQLLIGMMQYLSENEKNHIQLFGHSQGAAIARSALRRLPPHYRKRVTFVGIAPAAHDAYEKSVSYRISTDFVPKYDKKGLRAAVDLNPHSVKTLQKTRSGKSPIEGHAFTTEAYEKILEDHIKAFLDDPNYDLYTIDY